MWIFIISSWCLVDSGSLVPSGFRRSGMGHQATGTFGAGKPHSSGWLSKYMWLNLFQMVAMIVVMSFVASNDRLFHERMKMERLMKQKNYAEALKVGRKSLQTDSSLTMLRIACLHHTGELADKLFSYPLVGGSKAMLPDSVTVKSLMWRSHRWMHEPTDSMKMQHLVYRKPEDYKLCALLLDKKLDQFVVALCKHYDVKTAEASYPLQGGFDALYPSSQQACR